MESTEFIDTYSDDILYLYDMREALLSHPLRNTTNNLFSSSFSRIYCVFMIGNLEAMIKKWSNHNGILSEFLDNSKSNNSRIDNLYLAFIDSGINVDKEILQDYLAIKYLRNTIVHSGWNENQKSFILDRDFPIDSRELNDSHLQKMMNVNENMMFYIALISILDTGKKSLKNNDNLMRENVVLPEVDGIIRKKQYPVLIWNNLERIVRHFDLRFGKIKITENDELRNLAEEALFFWDEYKRHRLTGEFISKESITSSMDVLKNLQQSRSFIKFPIGISKLKALYYNLDEQQILDEQLLTLFKGDAKYSGKDRLKAIITGEEIYNRLPNLSVLRLFVQYLPQILPEKNQYFVKEAKMILNLFELSRYYYHYIEQNTNMVNLKETIQFYEEKIEDIFTNKE